MQKFFPQNLWLRIGARHEDAVAGRQPHLDLRIAPDPQHSRLRSDVELSQDTPHQLGLSFTGESLQVRVGLARDEVGDAHLIGSGPLKLGTGPR